MLFNSFWKRDATENNLHVVSLSRWMHVLAFTAATAENPLITLAADQSGTITTDAANS